MAECPCGAPAKVKYCSRHCAGTYAGGKRPKAAPGRPCRRCGRPIDGDNVYTQPDGRTRCRYCHLGHDKPKPAPKPRQQRKPPPREVLVWRPDSLGGPITQIR